MPSALVEIGKEKLLFTVIIFVLPPCHSYALAGWFPLLKTHSAFDSNIDSMLLCVKSKVFCILYIRTDHLSSTKLPNQYTLFRSLESPI